MALIPTRSADIEQQPRISTLLRSASPCGGVLPSLSLTSRSALTRGVYGHETGICEYVIGAMLALTRDFRRLDAALRPGDWQSQWAVGVAPPPVWPELAGKTIGILGYGRIGQCIARRARAFDMNVCAIRGDVGQSASETWPCSAVQTDGRGEARAERSRLRALIRQMREGREIRGIRVEEYINRLGQDLIPLAERCGRVMREALAALETQRAVPSHAVERSKPILISVTFEPTDTDPASEKPIGRR